MNEEKTATTYKEYKNGAEQVAGLGRLSCYKALDYLNKLLKKDIYYSEELEDSVVFIESYINRVEEENQKLKKESQKYKEVINKAIKHVSSLSSRGRDCMIYADVKKDILDILKEVD